MGALSDILRELEPSWPLRAHGWGQRRANEGPWVLFWTILALSGAEMGPTGAILEVKWEVNESQNRSKTGPKINAEIKLIFNAFWIRFSWILVPEWRPNSRKHDSRFDLETKRLEVRFS